MNNVAVTLFGDASLSPVERFSLDFILCSHFYNRKSFRVEFRRRFFLWVDFLSKCLYFVPGGENRRREWLDRFTFEGDGVDL